MDNLTCKDPTENYTPVGKAFCEGKCKTKAIRTEEGLVVLCDGCKRVVIDNRN